MYEFLKYRNYTTFDNGSETRLASYVAGLIKGDGHFSVRTTESGKYPKIECKFELTQRQIDHNNNDNRYLCFAQISINFSNLLLNLLDSKQLILNIELELLI